MKTLSLWTLLLPMFLLAAGEVQAQKKTAHHPLPAEMEIPLKYGADRLGKRQDDAMKRFRSNRLGLFLHWGLYSIPGGYWKGKEYKGAAEWLKSWAKVPNDEWLELMKEWNPKNFHADAWAQIAKNMGVKYVKITTKHHEGFCLWPSKYSKHTVAQTPYHKDILGELVKAYQKAGIDVHFYFSVMDWSDPDWRYNLKTHEDSIAFKRFLDRTEKQLVELATQYPMVKDFWFDGTWDQSIKKNGKWTAHIEQTLKKLIPGVTINSRLRADDYGKRHFDSNGHLMGDYESGYERRLPDPNSDLQVTRWDWEACMTIPENQWGYHKDWSLSYVKNPCEVLERIVHAVSMGGNMVVNFGPTPEGTFRKEELAIADYIGKWMKQNGEAIYGCDYAELKKQDWGYFTRNSQYTYMVVFNMPFSGRLTVKVPKGKKILEAETLNGKKIRLAESTTCEYQISTPHPVSNEPFVIRLKIDQGANEVYQAPLT